MTEYIRSMRKHIGHKRLILVGASVFVYKGGKLLLQKRKDNGCWSDHGGAHEPGETIEETAKRELFEETGLIANSLELIGVFSGKELFYTYPNGDKVANVNIAYLCEDFSGELMPQTGETEELRWFDLGSLPQNISPPVKPALMRCVEILTGRFCDIRNQLANPNVQALFAACCYEMSQENAKKKLEEYSRNPNWHLYGWTKNGEIIGVCGFVVHPDNVEINGIAVAETVRHRGVGGAMISALQSIYKQAIHAETDDDAIGFYQKCGFSTTAIQKHGVRRWVCVLSAKERNNELTQ